MLSWSIIYPIFYLIQCLYFLMMAKNIHFCKQIISNSIQKKALWNTYLLPYFPIKMHVVLYFITLAFYFEEKLLFHKHLSDKSILISFKEELLVRIHQMVPQSVLIILIFYFHLNNVILFVNSALSLRLSEQKIFCFKFWKMYWYVYIQWYSFYFLCWRCLCFSS